MYSIILCGMQFGDEGKGTFTDYLADKVEADAVIRYNGGSQASHTVTTPNGIVHKFSQLGSGMFSEKCHTYLTENMVVNLDNLLFEINVFCKETGYSFKSITNSLVVRHISIPISVLLISYFLAVQGATTTLIILSFGISIILRK